MVLLLEYVFSVLFPPLVFQHDNDHCLAKKAKGKGDGLTKHVSRRKPYWAICGASSNERWRSARYLTSTSSVMSSWRSGRGLQWQPVKLWWTPCPRGLRHCCKIMVATQNIDTLGPIWIFSLRGIFTFVASGLDINGCVLSYFEGTANLHCYTSCTLNTLHCSKVSFLQCCHMKRSNKILRKMWGVYSLLWYTDAAALHPSYDQWDPCGEGEQLQVPRCKHLRGPDLDCTHPNTGQESQAKTVPSATAEEIQGLTSYPENFLFRGHRKCSDSVHLSVV